MKKHLGIKLVASGIVFGLAAIWFWAVVGMSSKVGVASTYTTLTLVLCGVAVSALEEINRV